MLVGLDFDNTIINYDLVFVEIAQTYGLSLENSRSVKKELRDHLRNLPGGEMIWQKVQAQVYGAEICRAKPAVGVLDFMKSCVLFAIPLCIVSHKSVYAKQDTIINLRDSALAWLRLNCIIGNEGVIGPENIYFEATRAEKIERIQALGCTHFVDDLKELFVDPAFPSGVDKILFSPDSGGEDMGLKAIPSWEEIGNYILRDRQYA